MVFRVDSRVKETTATAGTGTLDLAGAVAGFRTFVAGLGTGNVTHYLIADSTDFEEGVGTITAAAPDTLSRDTVIDSSNAGAKVNWPSNAKNVFCVASAAHLEDLLDHTLTPGLLVRSASAAAGNTHITRTIIGGVGIEMTFGNGVSDNPTIGLDIAKLTLSSGPAATDEIAVQETGGAARRKMTLDDMLKVVNLLTSSSDPQIDDQLLWYDTSVSAARRMTPSNFFKVINKLTVDNTPDLNADFVATYDASAGLAKRVRLRSLNGIILDTEQAATSGTAIDFTGIAAGRKRIIITFEGVSLSGTDQLLIQLGDAGGFETSGYLSTSSTVVPTISTSSSTAGFILRIGAGPNIFSGHMILTLSDSANRTWIGSHTGKKSTTDVILGGGDKSLSAELTQVRITRTGTDTFDAGSINIQTQ